MKSLRLGLVCVALATLAISSFSFVLFFQCGVVVAQNPVNQTGMVDPAYRPDLVNFWGHVLALQPDGKLLLVAKLRASNGSTNYTLCRLNVDGSLDQDFALNFGTEFNGEIWAIGLQSDGHIVVAGDFWAVNNDDFRKFLIRVNSNGEIDKYFGGEYGFYFGLDSRQGFRSVQINSNDWILATGGGVRSINNGPLNYPMDQGVWLFKKNPYGVMLLPSGFYFPDYGPEPNLFLPPRIQQSDGSTLVATNGTILKFSSNDILETGFHPEVSPAPVRKITVDLNDKILVLDSGIYRLNPDGSRDATFPKRDVGLGGVVVSFVVENSGNIIVGGYFQEFDGTPCNGLVRLLAAYPPDPPRISSVFSDQIVLQGESTTLSVAAASSFLTTCQWLHDGNAIQGATNRNFTIPNARIEDAGLYSAIVANQAGATTSAPVRLRVANRAAGSIDSSFHTPVFVDGSVNALVILPDGKILVAGKFSQVDGLARSGIARLESDGTVDASFVPVGTEQGGAVLALALQNDGKILVVGDFNRFNEVSSPKIVRLNSDGSLDTSFISPMKETAGLAEVSLLSDGRILVAGSDTNLWPYPHRIYLWATLESNGEVNPPNYSSFLEIKAVNIDADGRTLLAGFYSLFSPYFIYYSGILRLNKNASLDMTFQPEMAQFGEPYLADIHDVSMQSDGHILFTGSYLVSDLDGIVNFRHRGQIGRLNPDGTTDRSYNTFLDADETPNLIVALSNGEALVAGSFTNVGGLQRPGMVRLDAFGNLDRTFTSPLAPGSIVNAAAELSDGRILIAGESTSGFILRLFSTVDTGPPISQPRLEGGRMLIPLRTESGVDYVLETSYSLRSSSWQPVATLEGDGMVREFSVVLSDEPQAFFRIRSE